MLAELKRRIPDAVNRDALLTDLLNAAGDAICAYTGRGSVPEALRHVQIEIAVMQYNRMGMEGERAHSEGSVSRSCESLPEWVRARLNPWRLARTVGGCG